MKPVLIVLLITFGPSLGVLFLGMLSCWRDRRRAHRQFLLSLAQQPTTDWRAAQRTYHSIARKVAARGVSVAPRSRQDFSEN